METLRFFQHEKQNFLDFFTWFCPRRSRRHIVERLKWIRIQTLTEKLGFSFQLGENYTFSRFFSLLNFLPFFVSV